MDIQKTSQNLLAYLKHRASLEGQECSDDMLDVFTFALLSGTRRFFGIEIDNSGTITRDRQNPEAFKKWKLN